MESLFDEKEWNWTTLPFPSFSGRCITRLGTVQEVEYFDRIHLFSPFFPPARRTRPPFSGMGDLETSRFAARGLPSAPLIGRDVALLSPPIPGRRRISSPPPARLIGVFSGLSQRGVSLFLSAASPFFLPLSL